MTQKKFLLFFLKKNFQIFLNDFFFLLLLLFLAEVTCALCFSSLQCTRVLTRVSPEITFANLANLANVLSPFCVPLLQPFVTTFDFFLKSKDA